MKVAGLFDKKVFEARRRALASFSAWEAIQPIPTAPKDVIARLDEILRLAPPRTLSLRRPEDYAGVALLHRALSHLGLER